MDSQSSQTHKLISIDGNIGSGKSTLMEALKNKFKDNKNVVFLREPVDEWAQIKDENNVTILEKFYANQKEYSFPFQMMAYISRLSLLKDAVKNNPGAIFISERSLFTDREVFAKMLYKSGFIEEVNYKIYLKWFDSFSSDFPLHKVIYVKADPQVCFDRIKTRSRTGESNIPLAYLENCHIHHNEMLDITNPNCICDDQIVLDGNIDIYQNDNQLDRWIQEIEEFIV
uniref:Deoxynucleoside kinase domain-containing protein n=1 Tax=viral metagenome TaxID=1070528 RepID=A0A6C0IH27_9ZZZZ